MTQIPSQPTSQPHAVPVTPSDAALQGQAASLLRFGAADGAIAQVSVALDQQQRRAQHQERRAQALRHEQAVERVHQLREAAKKQRGAGILSAVGQVAQGVVSLLPGGAAGTGAGPWQAVAMAVNAGSEVGSSALSWQGERARTDAKEHDVLARTRGDEAAIHGATAADARSMRDRAQTHLDAVARARAQARMAALRG